MAGELEDAGFLVRGPDNGGALASSLTIAAWLGGLVPHSRQV